MGIHDIKLNFEIALQGNLPVTEVNKYKYKFPVSLVDKSYVVNFLKYQNPFEFK